MRKLLFLVFVLFAKHLDACDCPPLTPISKELSAEYDVIFQGKVDSIVPCSTQGIGTAYFTIQQLYKGAAEQHVAVDFDCTSACMMSFQKGEEWLIYGIYLRFDLITVNLCSHSRKKVTDGTIDFYEASAGRTYDAETEFLKTTFGEQPFKKHETINDQQQNMGPVNEKPSGINTILLLIASFAAMGIVYLVSKKCFKNDN